MHPSIPSPRPLRRPTRTIRGERGEGVISTAIAVLVMAFLGAAMWVTFNAVWKDTSKNTENQVKIIGTDSDAPPAATP
ncbi:MAG: hypothetical protein ACSLFO_03600 [Acidimicrobiales bacterium]